ncbi:MAG: nucleotidyltransferase domain-containing protein [Nanoarchaeota archaeon]
MLNSFNDLSLFFEDNYRRINVREYSRIKKISPPTASKILKLYKEEELLLDEHEKNFIYYLANKESKVFIDIARIYWYLQLKKIGLLSYIENELVNPLVILFGSLSKAEIKKDSDVDIAVFTISKKDLSLKDFEKKINRNIQVFYFKSKNDVKNKELLNNILNGFILTGSW